MPIGYGYQSSDAASYVNWAAVTKGFTDVLDADTKDRESRKAEFEKQDREIAKQLANQPLGQFEDGNTFTNNAVDAISNQRLITNKLWKSGRLKEKDYRLIQNNTIDNTNTLFDLQKKYQEAAADRMKGLQDGTYQPLTSSNMALIEGFKDFKDSVPIVDPKTGIINIAKKKYNEKTKTWDIEYGKTMPVNMAMNLISTPAAAYKIDPIIDKDVASMGTLKDALYQAASKNGAGTITDLLGPEGFQKYPGAADVITNFNNAVNGKIEQYLTDPLHITSVLTMNVGGYSAESFTYDKAEAAKDPSKILMKIDPSSKYPTMDQSGPNYKKQKEEAAGWIKTQFMSRIDRERKIQTTSQLNDQSKSLSAAEIAAGKDRADNAETGEMIAALYSGSDEDVASAMAYFKGLSYVDDMGRLKNGQGFWVDIKDSNGNIDRKTVDFTANGKEIGVENAVKAGTKLFLQDKADTRQSLKNIGKYKKQKRNTAYSEMQEEVRSDYSPEVKSYIASVPKGSIIKGDDTIDNVGRLADTYGDLGFTFERKDKGIVKVVSLDSKGNALATQDFNIFDSDGEAAPGIETQINNWIVSHHDAETARKKLAPTMKDEKGNDIPTKPVGTKTKAMSKGSNPAPRG